MYFKHKFMHLYYFISAIS